MGVIVAAQIGISEEADDHFPWCSGLNRLCPGWVNCYRVWLTASPLISALPPKRTAWWTAISACRRAASELKSSRWPVERCYGVIKKDLALALSHGCAGEPLHLTRTGTERLTVAVSAPGRLCSCEMVRSSYRVIVLELGRRPALPTDVHCKTVLRDSARATNRPARFPGSLPEFGNASASA